MEQEKALKITTIEVSEENVTYTEDIDELRNAEQGCAVLKPFGVMEAKAGLRDAFVPPEGYVWMCADYCLDPKTNILTKRGNVLLQDLKEGDSVYTPWGYKKCFNIRKTGKHKVVRIKLKTGEVLRCSPEHRICVKRDEQIMWVYAVELKPTDYIFSINNTKYFEQHGISSDDIKQHKKES